MIRVLVLLWKEHLSGKIPKFFFFCNFIYLREGERAEQEEQADCAECGVWHRVWSHDPKIRPRGKIKSQMLNNWTNQAPGKFLNFSQDLVTNYLCAFKNVTLLFWSMFITKKKKKNSGTEPMSYNGRFLSLMAHIPWMPLISKYFKAAFPVEKQQYSLHLVWLWKW